MEHNIFDRVFEKTYGPAIMPYGCLSDAETIRVREAVQSLRQSYQPQYADEACVSRYHTEENRKAYMLAYYPYYVEPACRVVRDYVVPALQERQAFYPVLNLAFFAGGPCPEMYGTLKALRGAQLHEKTAVTILDWECGWNPSSRSAGSFAKKTALSAVATKDVSSTTATTSCHASNACTAGPATSASTSRPMSTSCRTT